MEIDLLKVKTYIQMLSYIFIAIWSKNWNLLNKKWYFAHFFFHIKIDNQGQ